MAFKFLSKNKISQLPRSPGVYAFKNKGVLYIGKAINIQERVKNHFQQPGFKESIFLDKTEKIGFIKTDSEIEALILEAKLIKKQQPKYNVIWRDDKNYFFVAKTKEDFPSIFITHQIKNKSASYVGPFIDGKALKQTLKILRKIFTYRSCKNLPKKPCLWYQLDRCSAPCLLESGLGRQIPSAKNKLKKELKNNIYNIFKILKGGKNKVLKDLKKEIETASKTQNFEQALKIRDKVFSLERVISHSRLLLFEEAGNEKKTKLFQWIKARKNLQKLLKIRGPFSRIEAYDISNIQGQLATGSMITFIKGKPNKNFYRKFRIKIEEKPNDVAMIKEILSRRFKHPEWPYPDLILIDGGITQFNAAKSVVRNKNIPIMALAKKENKLFIEGKEVIFLKKSPREVFDLVLQLRDEAHRFAITYHKKLRKVDFFKIS
jgi:excinuclease ABC subunit C